MYACLPLQLAETYDEGGLVSGPMTASKRVHELSDALIEAFLHTWLVRAPGLTLQLFALYVCLYLTNINMCVCVLRGMGVISHETLLLVIVY
jgi:hypothetical protein